MTLCLCELENLLSQQTYPVQEITEGSCELTEEDKGVVLYSFTLSRCAERVKIVKIVGSQPNVFQSRFAAICDYVIFIPSEEGENSVEVVFCELKKTVTIGRDSPYELGRQIKGTIPLLQYIVKGMDVHFDKEINVTKEHYVLLCRNLRKIGDVNWKYLPIDSESESNYDAIDKTIPHNEKDGYAAEIEYDRLPISLIKFPKKLAFNHLMEAISS